MPKDDDTLPQLLVVGISLIGIGLLIANTALVAWFIIRKRIKGKTTALTLTPIYTETFLLHFISSFSLFFAPAGFLLCIFILLQCCHSSTIVHLSMYCIAFFVLFNFYLLACCSCSCSIVVSNTVEKKIIPMDIQHTAGALLSFSYIFSFHTLFFFHHSNVMCGLAAAREIFVFSIAVFSLISLAKWIFHWIWRCCRTQFTSIMPLDHIIALATLLACN